MKLPIEIDLPMDFWAAETRCEYLVSEKQKKVWAVQLDLLQKLLSVCERHKIEIMAFGGTLLGAVRHKGFIPWDDDIDVALTRDNYEKLCVIAEREFDHPYFFQTALSDTKCFFPAARLRNSLTTAAIVGQGTADYNNGIYIDIFALDGISDCTIKKWVQNCLVRVIGSLLNLYFVRPIQEAKWKEIIKGVLRPFAHCLKYETIFKIYKKALMLYNFSSSKIGLVAHGRWFRERYWIKRSEIEELVPMEFENIQVPVPRDWDGVLSRTYGKYREFPPASQRGAWHDGQIVFDPDLPYVEYFKMKSVR